MSKSTEANTEQQENQPLTAECYLCGYTTPVSGYDDPILLGGCPNCGGFTVDFNGNEIYDGGSLNIVENDGGDGWIEYLKKSEAKRKKRK